jgi:hypothetical protein
MSIKAWSNRWIFQPHRARAHFYKATIYERLENPLKAKGLMLHAQKLKADWLKDHRAMRELDGPHDYDGLVKCWER